MTSSAASTSTASPAARRSTPDRLALIKQKAESRAAQKVSADVSACLVVIDRIERRGAAMREAQADRRRLETRADRRRANLLRKNPHVERDSAIQVGRRMVTDPTTLGRFVEVQVNKQLDVLMIEHSARPQRISDVEFAVGRLLQEAWAEKSERRASQGETPADFTFRSGESGDGTLGPREIMMLRTICRARSIAELNERLAGVIGWVGVRFLRAILVEGHTIKSYAERTLGGGDRAAGRVGDRFRWLLSEVANHMHTATGAEGQSIRATREAT